MAKIKIQNVTLMAPSENTSKLRLLNPRWFEKFRPRHIDRDKTGRRLLLDDINLSISDGSRVGLIGSNGAGKTSLLRLISGIYKPDNGKLTSIGKITPFFENQSFLNLEATGYENIELHFKIQNYKGGDYSKYLQFVENFTELGANLDVTVNKYSNGMQGRLGLALSLLEKPDILLIDENIGAGDAHFQERTALTLEQYIHSVPIVVMASHSETLMRQYCNKAAFMKNGKVIFFGNIDDAFIEYNKS